MVKKAWTRKRRERKGGRFCRYVITTSGHRRENGISKISDEIRGSRKKNRGRFLLCSAAYFIFRFVSIIFGRFYIFLDTSSRKGRRRERNREPTEAARSLSFRPIVISILNIGLNFVESSPVQNWMRL